MRARTRVSDTERANASKRRLCAKARGQSERLIDPPDAPRLDQFALRLDYCPTRTDESDNAGRFFLRAVIAARYDAVGYGVHKRSMSVWNSQLRNISATLAFLGLTTTA